MVAVHPSRQISVTSVGWWIFNCQMFSCLAVKTIPFCCEIVITFCPFSSEVHASIRCIKSDVARTSRSNCKRKALDFLRLFGDGYFKESDTKIMNVTLWGLALFHMFQMKAISLRGITQKRQLCFWHFIFRANSHSWVGIYRLNYNNFVFKRSVFPNGTLLPSFSVENAIILWSNLN